MSRIAIIEPGDDGYYHPRNEQEIIDLVKHAYQNDLQLRVRGSGHSVPKAIFTGDYPSDDIDVNLSPPKGNINIWLNQYNRLVRYHRTDEEQYLVTVQAGMHLSYDRNDPCSQEKESLLYLLQNHYGLALTDLGGIARQTVSGVLCTGTAGGSLTYDLKENVYAMRIIDGKGEVYEVSQSDPDFDAALVSLGLLGVISTVTFQCRKTFNIQGIQTCTTLEECEIDIFSNKPVDGKKTGLVPFFRGQEADYARILWWPQQSAEMGIMHQRLQVWKAQPIDPTPQFEPEQFKLFESTELMIIYTYLMSLMGNIENLDTVAKQMITKQIRFEELMTEELQGKGFKKHIAEFFTYVLQLLNHTISHLITNLVGMIPQSERKNYLPIISAGCLLLFAPLDKHNFIHNFRPHRFHDYWWRGLPMDNSLDDVIVPNTFTEIWFPLQRATDVTHLLQQYFQGGYECYGNNMWELYTSKPSSAWMSMSYSNGDDEWKDGAFRIDPNWYIGGKKSARDFFIPLWKLLRNSDIPFRLHWAKLKPRPDDTDWREFLCSQYPQIQKFLDFRSKKDPKQIFVNHYWRKWFNICKQN
jgi:D-arabinono-1,4-lactone oxidase